MLHHGAGSLGDLNHHSPQAVFTSFKLPKPGAPANVSSATAAGQLPPGLFAPRFPLPPSLDVEAPSSSSTAANVLSAPLGGLPAMATQLAAAAKKKTEDLNQILSPGRSPSPTGDPPGDPTTPKTDDSASPAKSSSAVARNS